MLAVLGPAACSGQDSAVEAPASVEQANVPTTIEDGDRVVTITGVPSHGARFAYGNGKHLLVVARGVGPIVVGEGVWPVWSTDSRYLAWSRDEASASDSADLSDLNTPASYTVYVLDTATGERVRFHSSTIGLNGTLLSVDGGFVAVASGQNNLGQGATDFAILRFDDLVAGREPAVVHSVFEPDDPGLSDFDWIEARNEHLYVVVTDASTTYYRFNPVLWRVDLAGEAERLFSECDGAGDEGCDSNAGFFPLSVSPDERYVAFDGGMRNGCEVYSRPTLTPLGGYSPVPLVGLPVIPDDVSAAVGFVSVGWTSTDSFVATVDYTGFLLGEAHCSNPSIETDQLYRCSTDGRCQALGIEARWATVDSRGDIAYVEPGQADSGAETALVQWADGAASEIGADRGSGMAWSP